MIASNETQNILNMIPQPLAVHNKSGICGGKASGSDPEFYRWFEGEFCEKH